MCRPAPTPLAPAAWGTPHHRRPTPVVSVELCWCQWDPTDQEAAKPAPLRARTTLTPTSKSKQPLTLLARIDLEGARSSRPGHLPRLRTTLARRARVRERPGCISSGSSTPWIPSSGWTAQGWRRARLRSRRRRTGSKRPPAGGPTSGATPTAVPRPSRDTRTGCNSDLLAALLEQELWSKKQANSQPPRANQR